MILIMLNGNFTVAEVWFGFLTFFLMLFDMHSTLFSVIRPCFDGWENLKNSLMCFVQNMI